MLDDALKQQLKSYLERVTQPIALVASLESSEKSSELAALLDEIASLSGKITVTQGDHPRKPSFAIKRVGSDVEVRFAGIPLGHEFTSLVLALLQVGGHPPKADAEVQEQIRNLTGEYRFETYFSLSCQNCPDVVQALNMMSVLNPRIRHTAIDGALFQTEVEQRQIMAVPAIYLNGELFAQGRMGLEEILQKLDTGAAARAAEQLSQKPAFDVLVLGSGPAGAAAAIYAARKGIRTGIVTERLGGQVLDTLGIENLISVAHTEGPQLANVMAQSLRDYGVDVMAPQTATALTPAAETGGLISVTLASGALLKSRTVILATGARWRHMNVPGEDQYRNKGVAFCPHCDGPLFKGKNIAVIGGGNSGVEAAIDLAGIAKHVTLIEFDHALRADAVLQNKLSSLSNTAIVTSAHTQEVHGENEKVSALSYRHRQTDEMVKLDVEGVFVQIGLVPNTEWLKGSLALSPRGEIDCDARGSTSMAGVFAAGDATTTPYKQIIIAMGEGAKAALSAFDYLIRTAVPDAKP